MTLLMLRFALNKCKQIRSERNAWENARRVFHDDHLDKTLWHLRECHKGGLDITRDSIFTILQACINKKNVHWTRMIHSVMVSEDLHFVDILGDNLIRLFGISGSWFEATLAFCQVLKPTVYSWNEMMFAHARCGRENQVVVLFDIMQNQDVVADEVTFLVILKACGKLGALREGKLVHHQIVSSEIQPSINVGNTLVDMYSKCGCLDEAHSVFVALPHKDIVSWGALFWGYFHHVSSLPALQLYAEMECTGIEPSKISLMCVLKACGIIKAVIKGMIIHEKIIKLGLASDVGVGNALVDMYAKCECLDEAAIAFTELPFREITSWSALVVGFYGRRNLNMVFEMFTKLELTGIQPNETILLCVLRACGSIGEKVKVWLLHDKLIKNGYDQNITVRAVLIGVYGKFGAFDEIQSIFDYFFCSGSMWSLAELSESFEEGFHTGFEILYSMVYTCGKTASLEKGRLTHAAIVETEFASDITLMEGLLCMYVKCESYPDARKVFNHLQCQNTGPWTGIIYEYIKEGNDWTVLECIMKMQKQGMQPNQKAFSFLLQTYGSKLSLDGVKVFHKHVKKRGWEFDKDIGNILVDVYARHGNLDKACEIFNQLPCQDIIGYRAMIISHAHLGLEFYAMDIYIKMQEEGVTADKVSLLGVLKSCGSRGTKTFGRLLHYSIVNDEILLDIVLGNALVDMYFKVGSPEDARSVFNMLPEKNVVSWSTLIAGYTQNGNGLHALELYENMQENQVSADEITATCTLKACGSLGSIKLGRLLNDDIIRLGLDADVIVGSALVDMYAKSGSMTEASSVFRNLTNRNLITWGALIAGYALQGNFIAADKCISEIEMEGSMPDVAIFTNLLTACSHAGFLENGCQYFNRIKCLHHLLPNSRHYNCMINIFARAGCLEEAEALVRTMHLMSDIIGWKSLLSGCKAHGHKDIARRGFDQVMRMNPNDAGGYMIMSNIYSDAQSWQDLQDIQDLKKYSDAWKKPGKAWIEVNAKTFEFTVNGTGFWLPHESSQFVLDSNVSEKIWRLSRSLKCEAYVPLMESSLQFRKSYRGAVNDKCLDA